MMKMDTIYCYNPLFNYLVNMFCRNGKPLPGNYVTANNEFSNKYIYNINDDIHSKKALQHFSGQYFFPETFFSMEKFNSTKTDSLFFLKSYLKDNASGIKILDHKSVPPLVPANHLLQTEIKSKLYNQRKFDIRVLLCVKRTGDIMIYKNPLDYWINGFLYLVHVFMYGVRSTTGVGLRLMFIKLIQITVLQNVSKTSYVISTVFTSIYRTSTMYLKV